MIPVSKPSLGALERSLVNDCLDSQQITYGPRVQAFERDLAEKLGSKYALTTSSGTTALHLALVALGIGPGHEVIVPNLTFVATANAAFYTGAKVVLADIDPKTWCIDPVDVANKITGRTKAIIPVHLYGVPADITSLLELADIHKLLIVEDAAEGLGGTYNGRALGTLGKCGTFSFYGNKIITTGEGGAVLTDDERLYKRMFLLRGQAHSPVQRYYHTEIGFNYRMTDLQAALGGGQIQRLDKMVARRREILRLYHDRLSYYGDAPCVRPDAAPWLYTFLPHSSKVLRDDLVNALTAAGVETRPGFVPLNRMPMYRQPDHLFPASTFVGDHALSLPTFVDLSFQDVDKICDVMIKALEREAPRV